MKTLLTAAALSMSLSAFAAPGTSPKADIAILLDTSGSMQGLINQVRDGLWQTLNNLGTIKRDGKVAELRLALYEYGSGVVPAESNFLQMLSPLTTDHTKIAEKLFATKASGSQEFSGTAISMASTDLKWATDHLDFKSIVIAGNETINQGPVKPLEAAADALKKDIIVNSIFAGPQTIQSSGNGGGFGGGFGNCRGFFCPTPPPTPTFEKNPIFAEWESLAKAGSGETINIDHNNSIPYIESPFDERIVEVTEEINKTFLPFGKDGQSEYDRMIDLDRNIRNSGAGSYIGWGSYRGGNFGTVTLAKWDLVTAMKENPNFDLSKIKDEHLPEIMRGKTLVEKLKIVAEFTAKRDALEKEQKVLNEKRRLFVEEEIRNRQEEGEANFAEAFKDIIVKQLEAKGFSLE